MFFRALLRRAGIGRGGHIHLKDIVGFNGGKGKTGIGAVAMRWIGAQIAAVCTWIDDVGKFVWWVGHGHWARVLAMKGRVNLNRGMMRDKVDTHLE